MDTLFSSNERVKQLKNAPLAVRMRPSTLDDYVGQKKAVGPGSWLRSAIEHDVLSSVILYGPAGTGKTTLAHIIASHTKSEFVEVSAVTGTVKDLRREIDEAKHRLMMVRPPHHLVHRRDPSLLSFPARCPAPRGREPYGRHDRRHDGEPVLRGELSVAVAQPRRGARAPGR